MSGVQANRVLATAAATTAATAAAIKRDNSVRGHWEAPFRPSPGTTCEGRQRLYHIYKWSSYKWTIYNCAMNRRRTAKLLEVDEFQTQLGTRIRSLREKRGYTQESFGDICGFHRNFVGAVERGRQNLTLKSLRIIAKGLGTSMSELLSGLG
jgi:DNA-binding XRE family transcriptional regulator